MKKFESFEELLNDLEVDNYDRKYANDELRSFLQNEGSTIVENQNEEPYDTFQLELPQFNFEIGVTSIEIKEDMFKSYYWVINDNETELYKENKKTIDVLTKAIDIISSNAHSSNTTDKANQELNRIIDDGDYSKEAIERCIEKIKSACRYAGYFNIQYGLIKKVNEVLDEL